MRVSLLFAAAVCASADMAHAQSPPKDGETTIDAVLKAAADGKGGVIEDWIRDGGSVDDRDEADGNTALMVASGKCRLPILEFLLDSGTGRPSAPASLELQNELGYTALMLAAAYNQIPCVMKLLRAGANATAQALDGRTALQIARDRNAVDAVALLEREAGARERARASLGALGELVDVVALLEREADAATSEREPSSLPGLRHGRFSSSAAAATCLAGTLVVALVLTRLLRSPEAAASRPSSGHAKQRQPGQGAGERGGKRAGVPQAKKHRTRTSNGSSAASSNSSPPQTAAAASMRPPTPVADGSPALPSDAIAPSAVDDALDEWVLVRRKNTSALALAEGSKVDHSHDDEEGAEETKAQTAAAGESAGAVVCLYVGGLHCGGCGRRVESTLESLPAVRSVTVDVPTGRCEVRGPDGDLLVPSVLCGVVAQLGFECHPASRQSNAAHGAVAPPMPRGSRNPHGAVGAAARHRRTLQLLRTLPRERKVRRFTCGCGCEGCICSPEQVVRGDVGEVLSLEDMCNQLESTLKSLPGSQGEESAEETDALEGLLTNGPRDAELVLPALRLPCPCDY